MLPLVEDRGYPRRFSDELWSGIEDVYAAILAHPFLAGLASGELDRDRFQIYVVQDAHYLRDYARALSATAARAPAEDEIAMFASHAAGAIEVERELHAGFLSDFGLTEADVLATPLSPTTLAYTSYLLRVAHAGSFPEALAAVLPCYWIYREVGRALLERGSPNPLYRRWIDTYGGAEFDEVVTAVIGVTDRIGPELAPAERARAADHFRTTAKYEWMFWDAAWRRETWPVGG